MKRVLISMLILSCLITVVGCSKEKKSDTISVNNTTANSVSDTTQTQSNRVIEEKYRGTFVIEMDGIIFARLIFNERSVFSSLMEQEFTRAYTEGNELIHGMFTGTFTDDNTFETSGMIYKRQ